MEDSYSDIKISPLKIWEIPELLKFRDENEYKTPVDKNKYPESILYAALKSLWHGKRLATFLAKKDGKIIGYMSMAFGRYKHFRGNAYLIDAAVDKEHRSKGIGSALFKAAETLAKERGARRIELEVFAKNVRAIELYKRLGYEIEGTKRRAVEEDGYYDDLIFMAKFL